MALFPSTRSKGHATGKTGTNPNIIPVYLSIQNPLIIERNVELPTDIEKEIIDSLGLSKRSKYVILKKIDPINLIHLYQRKFGPIALKKLILNKNYDGVKYYWSGKNWMVFEPTQIKSAISNNGEYSSTNSDITK